MATAIGRPYSKSWPVTTDASVPARRRGRVTRDIRQGAGPSGGSVSAQTAAGVQHRVQQLPTGRAFTSAGCRPGCYKFRVAATIGVRSTPSLSTSTSTTSPGCRYHSGVRA